MGQRDWWQTVRFNGVDGHRRLEGGFGRTCVEGTGPARRHTLTSLAGGWAATLSIRACQARAGKPGLCTQPRCARRFHSSNYCTSLP